MDDLDLHLALEALRTNPAAHAYHERITRGMQAIAQGTLTPFERDALRRLLDRFPSTTPSPDPVAALITAFQDKLPTYDPAAVATAIQHALAQRPATLNGAPVTITMNGHTHAHQANLAIGNQVGGNLVQVTVTIPIPDARFDALLASALRTHEHEKTLARIRHAAQQIESDRLLNLRLKGFVGRVAELAAIREHIEAMRPTGGYVLIKAAAGEGKSSSIAKLIQEAGITATPHHFIALTTGREYQLGLLRAVVAQLILKHHLTVSYFPEESYPAMKGEFARILDELSKQGIHETIYLDGLDQLQPEIDGSRDLSFLPPQPPSGIVIVLGSRPDETLKPLEILHRVDYALPPLSEADALALWQSVQPGVSDGLLNDLYTALKGNALFVHLTADTMQGQSIVDATSLIRQIEQNPSNLFGISLERIKNRSEHRWPTIWKPMLALLLVAQEPLRLDVLGDLLAHDHDTMQDAVWVLGGLVSQGVDQRVALHHLLFRDYLAVSVFNQREVKRWHQRLADWCAIDLDSIWTDHGDPIEQARRVYARHHYITHLALAENWPMLWQVLDAGNYGEHKTRFDPSTRLYALDLDRGRESAIKAGQSHEEHIEHLPRLWKYSLLRTSLTSRLDQWPNGLFVVLAMLGRTQEALGRIELVSDPKRQIQLWATIIDWYDTSQQSIILTRIRRVLHTLSGSAYTESVILLSQAYTTLHRHTEAIPLLQHAIDHARSITHTDTNTTLLKRISSVAASIGCFDEALCAAQSIQTPWHQCDTIIAVLKAIIATGNFTHAITLAQSFDDPLTHIKALSTIAGAATHSDTYQYQALFLEQAAATADSIHKEWQHGDALQAVVQAHCMLGNLDEATRIASSISEPRSFAEAYGLLAHAHALNGNVSHACELAQSIAISRCQNAAWNAIACVCATQNHIHQALEISKRIDDSRIRADTCQMIAEIIATNGDIDAAIELTRYSDLLSHRDKILRHLALVLLDQGYIDRAIKLAQSIDSTRVRIQALSALTRAMVVQGLNIQASSMIAPIINLLRSTESRWNRNKALHTIVTVDDPSAKRAYAMTILPMIDDPGKFAQASCSIARQFLLDGYRDEARVLLEQAIKHIPIIDYGPTQIETLCIIAETIFTMGNDSWSNDIWQQALQIAQDIENPSDKAKLLSIIGHTTATTMNFQLHADLLHQARQVALSIPSNTDRPYTLYTLVEHAITYGNHPYALETAHAITEKEWRIMVFERIAQHAISHDNYDDAIALLADIASPWKQVALLSTVAQATITEKYDDALSLLDRALNLAREIFNPGKRIIALSTIAQTRVAIGQREDAITVVDEAHTLLYKMEQTDDVYSEAIVATALATARIGHDDDATTLLEQSIQHAASIDLSDKRTKSLRNIAQASLDIGNNQLAATIAPLIDTIDDRAAILKAMIEQHETTPSHAINLLQSAWQRIETHEKLWSLLPLITAIPMHSSRLVMGLLNTEEWVNAQLKRLG